MLAKKELIEWYYFYFLSLAVPHLACHVLRMTYMMMAIQEWSSNRELSYTRCEIHSISGDYAYGGVRWMRQVQESKKYTSSRK